MTPCKWVEIMQNLIVSDKFLFYLNTHIGIVN